MSIATLIQVGQSKPKIVILLPPRLMFTKKVIFASEKKALLLLCWVESENGLPEFFDRKEQEPEEPGIFTPYRWGVPPP